STFAAGDTARALQQIHAAADLEDVTEKQPVTPGELLPARELEADMLLAAARYADAQAAYERALAREPNRARSLCGLARSAALARRPQARDIPDDTCRSARRNN
ncbi:MAG TPA: hypothetical protein VG454_13930, partial [Gemmatimonadales bacterium]|nr:hypothetical protein [Gemmatimonadales bacterium]